MGVTLGVDHILKHSFLWTCVWHVHFTAVFFNEGLQFVPVLQLQQGSQAPHEAEEEEALQVHAAGQAPCLFRGDQALQQVHRLNKSNTITLKSIRRCFYPKQSEAEDNQSEKHLIKQRVNSKVLEV